MIKNLVIVESPAKGKTIEGFLGKDFTVKSSFGHIRDLPENRLGVDVENSFEPTYEISEDKKKIVAELEKLSKGAEIVWLASDEDREGEAIAWHLAESLKLDIKKTRRIVFHEITKSAILEAIEKPRKIDKHLVDAQQARRVLDRIVGYELSPVLWKKIKPSLSAGRVQSVAVRLIVEREKEIKAFVTSSAYKVTAQFFIENKNGKAILKAELPSKFKTKDEALAFLKKCLDAEFTVAATEMKPAKKSPAPPFTTSTLQQEASRKLGFSVARTMTLAQQLYEAGKITYMRTDSFNLSDTALDMAKTEITKLYGAKYIHIRKYTTKSKGAQEAHEAIRPTYLTKEIVDGDASQKKLYDLIWKRTIASQMSDAELERTTVSIDVSKASENFVAKGEVIKFDGFLKVYMESSDDDDDTESEQKDMLPPIKVGDKLDLKEASAIEQYTLHPPRFTEASLVKKLEELGVGRPSTYAPTISTIQKRGYVVNEDRVGAKREINMLLLKNNKIIQETKSENTGFEKSKLFPTDIGTVVTDYLVEHFNNILDYNFTANVELEFDEIAEGEKLWKEMIKRFYKPFHLQIEHATENTKKTSGQRLLGVDPTSNKNLYVKIGRYGPIAQIGELTDEEKPLFAGLMKGQSIETISLDEALELFKLPRKLGLFEGSEIVIGVGRFGPYVKHNSLFASLPKIDDPLSVTSARAIEVLLEKRQKDIDKNIKSFKENAEVKVLKGRWGAYINIGKENFKIPKGMEPTTLTLDDCINISKGLVEGSKPPNKKAADAKLTKRRESKPKASVPAKAKKTTKPASKKTAKKK